MNKFYVGVQEGWYAVFEEGEDENRFIIGGIMYWTDADAIVEAINAARVLPPDVAARSKEGHPPHSFDDR